MEFLAREPVPDNLGIIITIPCFNEPALINTLDAIHACRRPDCDVEVIVLINEPEQVSPEIHLQNERCFQEAHQWARWHQSPSFKYYILWIKNLPEKWSGVGLARKMAMDEAVRRFRRAGNQEGIIVCFDADSTCSDNYLLTVKQEFEQYRLNAASIHFEHPLEGDEDPKLYEGIIRYELHLRYYILAQQIAGFPYAFHAIGSSMAVRNDIYEKQGGMNRRKAGEDFYFLHKIIPLGQFKEITATTVIPSPRESDRVPFGTGKAMLDWMKNTDQDFLTYNPRIFETLSQFFGSVNDLYESPDRDPEIPRTMQAFLEKEDFIQKIREFRLETGLPLCFSIDAGPNIHALYPLKIKKEVNAFIASELKEFCFHGKYIDDEIGDGPVKIQ